MGVWFLRHQTELGFMYPREPDQTHGATVNSWMRGNASAADAFAPAFTVSANDPRKIFLTRSLHNRRILSARLAAWHPLFEHLWWVVRLHRNLAKQRILTLVRWAVRAACQRQDFRLVRHLILSAMATFFLRGGANQFADCPIYANAVPLDDFRYGRPDLRRFPAAARTKTIPWYGTQAISSPTAATSVSRHRIAVVFVLSIPTSDTGTWVQVLERGFRGMSRCGRHERDELKRG